MYAIRPEVSGIRCTYLTSIPYPLHASDMHAMPAKKPNKKSPMKLDSVHKEERKTYKSKQSRRQKFAKYSSVLIKLQARFFLRVCVVLSLHICLSLSHAVHRLQQCLYLSSSQNDS